MTLRPIWTLTSALALTLAACDGGGGSAATCVDGVRNQGEEGVDCGGPCPLCSAAVATCDDGVENQGEAGVDCGGPCPACGATAASCEDGVQNQGEEGVDCGGPCPLCSAATPTCDDGVQNQGEAGLDCGGPCPACAATGAPQILTFTSNVTTLYEDSDLVLSVVVTDPDGIEDLIGGTLRDGEGGPSYGSFVSSAREGSYQLTLTWDAINTLRPIDGTWDGHKVPQARELVAEFFDQGGAVARRSLDIAFDCRDDAHSPCQGECFHLQDPAHCYACDLDCTAAYPDDAYTSYDDDIFFSFSMCAAPETCTAHVTAKQADEAYEGRTCAQICAAVGLTCRDGVGTGCFLIKDGAWSADAGCYYLTFVDVPPGTTVGCQDPIPTDDNSGTVYMNAACNCVASE